MAMIDVIGILQYRERGHIGGGSCEQSERLLGVVAYHHELVIELREERLDTLLKPLVSPCRQPPFFTLSLLNSMFSLSMPRTSAVADRAMTSRLEDLGTTPRRGMFLSSFTRFPAKSLYMSRPFYEFCDELGNGSYCYNRAKLPTISEMRAFS